MSIYYLSFSLLSFINDSKYSLYIISINFLADSLRFFLLEEGDIQNDFSFLYKNKLFLLLDNDSFIVNGANTLVFKLMLILIFNDFRKLD